VSSESLVSRVLVDTGPLVALLLHTDVHHQLCKETLRRIRPPLFTCWPVITEAAWLLRDFPRALEQLYRGPRSGVFRLLSLEDDALDDIAARLTKYRSLRPQLADLALVHLAERESIETIFTLDRRDFLALKLRGRRVAYLLPEEL
jgi:predicted nucleic acid-binding protein